MEMGELGILAAQVMDRVEEDFGEEATLRTVALVVEIDTGDATHIFAVCDDDRPWLQIEFLQQGIDSIEDRLEAMRSQDDDS